MLPIDNALHFGGIQDEINLTYISETGAFLSSIRMGFKTENIGIRWRIWTVQSL